MKAYTPTAPKETMGYWALAMLNAADMTAILRFIASLSDQAVGGYWPG
jgi:hypothetical protein